MPSQGVSHSSSEPQKHQGTTRVCRAPLPGSVSKRAAAAAAVQPPHQLLRERARVSRDAPATVSFQAKERAQRCERAGKCSQAALQGGAGQPRASSQGSSTKGAFKQCFGACATPCQTGLQLWGYHEGGTPTLGRARVFGVMQGQQPRPVAGRSVF